LVEQVDEGTPSGTGHGTADRSLARWADAPLAVVLVVWTAICLVAVTAGVSVGSVHIPATRVWQVILDHLSGNAHPSVANAIVWDLRLPRVLLAAVVGAGLATAGAVVQALVRNVLAEPFLLGVSSGASVGATAVLLFGLLASLGLWAISTGAILGAMGAMVTVFVVANTRAGLAPTQLILCGVVLAALFESITSFLIFRSSPQATQSVLFWLLGSFGLATWAQVVGASVVILGVTAFLVSQARPLNALILGHDAATSLGIDVRSRRWQLYAATSVIAGFCVAVSGVIGFVGLVIPHIVRLMVGSDHRRVLPVGILVGASFMVVADLLARTVVSPEEMPVGVVTAFIGAPVLLVLIRRHPYLYGGGA
jgi:iron complex transport system permease protein